MGFSKRLNRLMTIAPKIEFDCCSKIVLMSDCHRGVGNWGDDFLPNQQLFFAALTYYDENVFTYIELGDGDELWENRKLQQIKQVHSDVFWLMSKFYESGRFHMLFGNHDIIKKSKKYSKNVCETYYCEVGSCKKPLFPGIHITESIVLVDQCSTNTILLVHGHQGDLINDSLWKIGRFLVRYIWRPFNLIGIVEPTSAAKNSVKKGKIERRFMRWSDEYKEMIIMGHTHRPMFPQVGEPMYFNTGSCIHPRCITAIEIVDKKIALVKWCIMTREDRTLYVERVVLEGPISIKEYYK